jgi:hypothetical protein
MEKFFLIRQAQFSAFSHTVSGFDEKSQTWHGEQNPEPGRIILTGL